MYVHGGKIVLRSPNVCVVTPTAVVIPSDDNFPNVPRVNAPSSDQDSDFPEKIKIFKRTPCVQMVYLREGEAPAFRTVKIAQHFTLRFPESNERD